MDYGYFNGARPISPTETVDSSRPNPDLPFIFGRTPSLRLDIPSANPLPIPFPLSKPPLERRSSSLSNHSTSSTTSAQIPARPYQLPPGLADSPLPSALDVKAGLRGSSRLARGPRIDNEPPIPLEIQHLLLTTPPPPRFNATSSAFASMSYPPSVPADWEEPKEKMPTLMKRIRALTLRSRKEEQEVVVPARVTQPRQETLDLKKSMQRRIQVDTVSEGVPHTWTEYETLYAAGRLDIEDPPLPPLKTSPPSQIFPSAHSPKRPLPLASLSPYDLSHFPAPLHLSRLSTIRERLIASLDLLGTFLPSEDTILSAHLASYSPTPAESTTSPSFGIISSPSSQHTSATSRTHPSSFRSRGLSSASTSASTTYSTLQSSSLSCSPSSPFARSIRNHASLQALLSRLASTEARTSSPTSLGRSASITLFPTSPATAYLDVLASAGSHNSSKQHEIGLALDAHTILNGSKGLVVYDVERDWRFRGNREVEERNIRFYAGMPIFAPSSLSLGTADSTVSVAQFEEEAGGARIAIGVVSFIEELPRKNGTFGTAERAKLRSIASEITVEIEHFILQRTVSLEALSSRRTSATSAATFQSGSIPNLRSTRLDSRGSAPPSPQRARSGKGHVKKVSFDANAMTEPSLPPIASNPPVRSTPLPADESDSVPSLFHSHPPQKLLDLACASLARSLNLRLVYLVELDRLPPRPAFLGPSPRLALISSHGLPPSPDGTPHSANFDPLLHLRALRAPEGGLLYRAASSAEPFDSGMLLPVTEIDAFAKGWVIAGYAEEEGRTWGEEEMEIFEKVTKGVEKILLWREEGRR